MISQSDVAGRLRLLRYGLVVLVVITFLVSLLAPFVYTRDLGTSMTEFLGTAVLFTVVVGVLAVAVYFGYSMLLKRSMGQDSTS